MIPVPSIQAVLLLTGALNLLLPTTAVCLIALVAVRRVFSYDPAMRYITCLSALIVILLAPLFVLLQDRMGYSLLTLPLPVNFGAPEAMPLVPSAHGAIVVPAGDHMANMGFSLLHGISLAAWLLLAVWAIGVACGIARFVHGAGEVSRLRWDIRPWNPATMVEAEYQRMFPSRRVPPVYLSARIDSPLTIGLFRPIVLLPYALEEALTPAQLRHILLHEYAHIAFRHTLGGVVERLVRLFFWPHPLIPALCGELARAREEVCDNVASQGDGATCYARTLLLMAQGISAAPTPLSTLALLGPETGLGERIAGLLDPRRNRMVEIKRGNLWTVIGLVVTVMGLTAATVRVVAADRRTKEDVLQSFSRPDPFFVARMEEAKAKAAVTSTSATAHVVVLHGNSVDIYANPRFGPLTPQVVAEAKSTGAKGVTVVVTGRVSGASYAVGQESKQREEELEAREAHLKAQEADLMAQEEQLRAQAAELREQAADLAAHKAELAKQANQLQVQFTSRNTPEAGGKTN